MGFVIYVEDEYKDSDWLKLNNVEWYQSLINFFGWLIT